MKRIRLVSIVLQMFVWVALWAAAPAMAQTSSAQVLPADLHIRVLAASCAACHGTNGISVAATPSLAGMAPAHFLSRMSAFRESKTDSDVMTQHARGLTTDEINRLAAYFSALPASR